MNFFKQGRSVLFQISRAKSGRTRPPLVLIRPTRRMSAVPPRQVPTEEPPASPVEVPPDAPELPEPALPEIPTMPPDEAPDTPPLEMPQEEGWGRSTPSGLAFHPGLGGARLLGNAGKGGHTVAYRLRGFGARWRTVEQSGGGTRTGHPNSR